jgi:steroid delta-isomerase-like uncharacterized protein
MSETIQVVKNLFAAWNNHDLEGVAACYAPEYQGVNVAEASPQRGPAGVRRSMSLYLSAFPDLQFDEIETVCQDGRVAVNWGFRGTHLGTVLNIPPTGRQVQVCGACFFTLADGKIKRAMIVWDVAGLLRSIGLLPELQ